MAIQEAAVLTVDQSIEMDIAEGTQIYTVGYPILPKFPGHKELPIDGSNGPPTYPTMKHGYVATDWKNGDANIITIDCDIFPGNSGGPVWTRQQIYESTSYYLGMVSSFVPYIDEEAGRLVEQPRSPFKQNSGYAIVVPGIEILRMIDERQEELFN